MKETKGQFVMVPFTVLGDEDLVANAKLLYGLINSYAYKSGICFASRSTLADIMGLSESSITALGTQLVNHGYLKRKLIRNTHNKSIKERQYIPTKKAGQKTVTPSSINLDDTVIETKNTLPVEYASGGQEQSLGGQESIEIIETNNKEINIKDNKQELNLKISENGANNFEVGINETTNTEEHNEHQYDLVGYYSNEEIENYFSKDLFQMYIGGTSKNPNWKSKDELLQVELHNRRYDKSFEVFNRICKIVDEKELNSSNNSQRESILSQLLKVNVGNDLNGNQLERCYKNSLSKYFEKESKYPTEIDDITFGVLLNEEFDKVALT